MNRVIGKYNQLSSERYKLLKTMDRENPMVAGLEDQLTFFKIEIQERLKIEISRF